MFQIPNVGDAAYTGQAQVDKGDFDIVISAFLRTFVVDGCLVTAQGVPDMSVAVASGNVRIDGTLVPVPAAPSLPIDSADPLFGRFDLVTIDASGVAAVVAGLPAPVPEYADIPAARCVIAAVYVPAAPPMETTTVQANAIIDKRMFCTLPVSDIGEPPEPGTGLVKMGELTGTINGSNKVFTIPEDYRLGSFALYVGGIMVRPSGWSLSGVASRTVTFAAGEAAPQVGEWVGGTWQI